MATVIIPRAVDSSRFSLRVELSGVVYGIALIYNVREAHWYMTLSDADGVPLREGIKVVVNWTLLRTWVQQGRPDGEIMAIDPSSDDDPARDTLGFGSLLTYAD